jgi:hypothetical protein
MLVLVVTDRGVPEASPFADRRAFLGWQLGCLLLIVSLTAVGLLDGLPAGQPFAHTAGPTAVLYAARWLAGAAMLWASCRWLVAATQRWGRAA